MQKYIVNSSRENTNNKLLHFPNKELSNQREDKSDNLNEFNKQEFGKPPLSGLREKGKWTQETNYLNSHRTYEALTPDISDCEKQLSSNQASLFNVQFKDHNLLQDTGTSPIKTEIKNKDIEYATSDHKLNKYESNDCIRRNPKYSFIHNNRENLVRPKENHFRNTKYKTMVSNSTSIKNDDNLFTLKSTQKSRNEKEFQFHTASKPIITQINDNELNEENLSAKVRLIEATSPSCDTESLDLIIHNRMNQATSTNQKTKCRRLIGSNATTKLSPEVFIVQNEGSENRESHNRQRSANYKSYCTNEHHCADNNDNEDEMNNSCEVALKSIIKMKNEYDKQLEVQK